MGITIKALHVGDVGMDWSHLVFWYKPGRKTWIPINSFLINWKSHLLQRYYYGMLKNDSVSMALLESLQNP